MSAIDRLKGRAGPVSSERVVEIPLSKIRFDATQPRKAFHHIDGRVAKQDEEYIAELAEAIKFEGLIHAITVHELGDGTYQVVVGECRTRAHLLLGKPTIRAVIRNDLTDAARRLLFQLSENVNRQDLTDYELALSIKELMAGRDGVPPMKQVQIAQAMGKSEGWVSRFVKFGDDDLQRVWFQSGIADTVEKLYRLSTLPMPLQLDIQRRVGLAEGDPDRLEKPLNRDVIDKLTRAAKVKEKPAGADVAPHVPAPVLEREPATTPPADQGSTKSGTGLDQGDVIGEALSQAAAEGLADRSSPPTKESNPAPPTQKEYQLAPDARAAILGSVPQALVGGGERETVRPQVNCRVSLANILAFAEVAKGNKEVHASISNLWCDVIIPGPLAQLIANELTGAIVDDREVPAVVQNELTKLR